MLYALLNRLIRYAVNHGVPSERILARARACGVLPYLYAGIRQKHILCSEIGLPEALLNRQISAFRIEQTARLGLWHYSLGEVVRAIGDEHIVLKGAPLGQVLMSDALWRDTSDIDIWVSYDQRERVQKCCQSIGYEVGAEPHLWATNQMILKHKRLVPVEIHWALAPQPWISPSFEEAFARSRMIDSARGQSIRILGDSDLYVNLLMHAHQHYFSLKTLCDLSLAQEKLEKPEALLAACHLQKLDRFVVGLFGALLSEEISPKSGLAHLWFDSLLADAHRGTMVFAEGDARYAAPGVVLRAISMCLLDGSAVSADAALQVIFCGPHSVGRLCHAPYQVLRRLVGPAFGIK